MSSDIHNPISEYYSGKIIEHGATPRGVDWNSTESQFTRFSQLLKILPESTDSRPSLIDWGCGYGALLDFILERGMGLDYIGLDISPEMIEAAKLKHAHLSEARFHLASSSAIDADYVVASGLFSVKLQCESHKWLEYIKSTIADFDNASCKGFAFNCLTSYSDKDLMREDLYYADPMEIFDYCKKTFSRNVALLHDYDLYEFTVLVRKS